MIHSLYKNRDHTVMYDTKVYPLKDITKSTVITKEIDNAKHVPERKTVGLTILSTYLANISIIPTNIFVGAPEDNILDIPNNYDQINRRHQENFASKPISNTVASKPRLNTVIQNFIANQSNEKQPKIPHKEDANNEQTNKSLYTTTINDDNPSITTENSSSTEDTQHSSAQSDKTSVNHETPITSSDDSPSTTTENSSSKEDTTHSSSQPDKISVNDETSIASSDDSPSTTTENSSSREDDIQQPSDQFATNNTSDTNNIATQETQTHNISPVSSRRKINKMEFLITSTATATLLSTTVLYIVKIAIDVNSLFANQNFLSKLPNIGIEDARFNKENIFILAPLAILAIAILFSCSIYYSCKKNNAQSIENEEEPSTNMNSENISQQGYNQHQKI